MSIQRVAMLGAFAPEYTRHAVIRRGLEQVGIEVQMLKLPRNARTTQRLWHILRNFPSLSDCDAVIIPAFNQLSVPLVWLLRKVYRKPVLVDYLVGLTDVIEDRGAIAGWKHRLYRAVDRFNTTRMMTFTDTAAHRAYYEQLWDVSLPKMEIIPVGVRDTLAQATLQDPADDTFIVQYLGTFIPFHGVDTILGAADLLREEPHIQFELIGKGQTYADMEQIAETIGLDNVTFIPGFYHPPKLLTLLSRASVFLGVFGDSDKTRYVVPSKVYESMALGRPVITAESHALDEFFTPGEHLLTVPPNDPQALADMIRQLADDRALYKRIADSGQSIIHDTYLPKYIGERVKALLRR